MGDDSDVPDDVQLRVVRSVPHWGDALQRAGSSVLQRLGTMDHRPDVPVRVLEQRLHRYLLAELDAVFG